MKIEEIQQRRAQLLARLDQQRSDMGFYYAQCERSLVVVDAGWKLFRTIREHPVMTSVVTAVLGRVVGGLVTRRLGLLQNLGVWSGRLMAGWQLFQKFRGAFAGPR